MSTINRMKKVFIKTNGCQMNEYDSSKMVEVLHHAYGIEKTNTLEEADVILLNTCSIREKAQEKVFSQLGQWREFKENNPHVIIGVGGCVASQEGSSILKRAPYVDLVFGPQTQKSQLLIFGSLRSKNLTIFLHPGQKARLRLFQLWKDAVNTAVSALSPIPEVKKSADLLMMS